jgi:hypothetical protein
VAAVPGRYLPSTFGRLIRPSVSLDGLFQDAQDFAMERAPLPLCECRESGMKLYREPDCVADHRLIVRHLTLALALDSATLVAAL